MWKLLVIAAVIACCTGLKTPEEVFAWKEVSFVWPTPADRENAIKSGTYIPANNLPLGLDVWKDKLFVTVPRWKAGVAASLNYIPLNPINKTASLVPYPDLKANTLPQGDEKPAENQIISTFRVKVDKCDRLWVMETGLADILGEGRQISKPAIVVFDLNTDKLIRRYELPDSNVPEGSFFANIVVDVDPAKCDQAFAYIPDLGSYALVVYSWADNDSWRIKHNYFHMDPLKGDFTIGGINFQWTDGIFGLALGKRLENGYRTVYFHPLVGIREFSVSSELLQNKTAATDSKNYYQFKIEGVKGEQTQSSASVFDEKANVLFLTQLSKDGFACWNPKKPLNADNFVLVAQDKEKMIFTNDLAIDADRNLWVLSDKMPEFNYKGLDSNQVNYRIFRIKVDDAISGTACE